MKIEDKIWEFVISSLEESKQNNETFAKFCDAAGTYESPWCEAYWKNFDILVDSLCKLVNDNEDSWLCFYIYECDWGNSPQKVYIGSEEFLLDSWDKLRYCLEYNYDC